MAEQISSVNNEQVKAAAKLAQRKWRDATGKFLIEGGKCVVAAQNAGVEIDAIFTVPAVVKKIATTDTPPEIVAVAHQKIPDKSLLARAQKVVLFENIKDPGNLGTILRTCAAFDVDAIVLYGDCTDIYNPKCVRASVGTLWRTPVFTALTPDDLNMFENFTRIATLPRSENILGKSPAPQQPWLLMFGSEADGLSDELINFATTQIKIQTEIESLNLAVSAGIILHAIAG